MLKNIDFLWNFIQSHSLKISAFLDYQKIGFLHSDRAPVSREETSQSRGRVSFSARLPERLVTHFSLFPWFSSF